MFLRPPSLSLVTAHTCPFHRHFLTMSKAMLNTGTAGSGVWAAVASPAFCAGSSPSATLHVPVPVELPRLSWGCGGPADSMSGPVLPLEDPPIFSPTGIYDGYDGATGGAGGG